MKAKTESQKIKLDQEAVQLYIHTQQLAQAVVAGMKVAAAVEIRRYAQHRKGR